jgi:outer membrane receptor protein involved in Fe transport
MMSSKSPRLERSRLSAALFAALLVPAAGAAFAQDAAQQATGTDQTATTADQAPDTTATNLKKIVVTGSLIPQTALETFTPVTIITAEDLQTRGFTSVADALQQSSFSTGAVQGNQTSGSFTQSAETLSLFGLSPSYVKYLIDGRPMANYPALYNGSDVFNNISGIPIDLVERIEILPGGQSSLYGSDAIAGVVNVILKKRIDGTTISARIGGYQDGGGASKRISIADSFGSADGRFNMLVGAQFEKVDPIWGYQRDLTRQFNQHPYTGQPTASRDFLVYGPFTSYHFLDPANCGNVSSAFGGTTGVQTRPGFGDENYCGSMYTPGYRTLKNGKESAQFYSHATFDLTDKAQLYADVLYNKETSRYHIGSNYTWWGTGVEWGYYYDPRGSVVGNGVADAYGSYFCGTDPACLASLPQGDLLNLQRAFAPEDMGGWERSMNKDKSKSYAVTVGVDGTLGDSAWDYDVGATRTEYTLNEYGFARLAGPINQWFLDNVLGPQQGVDPWFGAYPVFTPDYAAFYQLIPQSAFEGFTAYTNSRSRTYDNMLRAQLTNGSLFSLPGGDAGVAFAVEAGSQGWNYTPDPRLLDGEIWGTTAVSGNGSRTRYAATGELRLPLFDQLTISASGRYDAFTTDVSTISKPTYSLGIEYRPFQSLMFRGKYGTAFKAPTLADQFQGTSGFYSFTTDYLSCNQRGFDPGNVVNCPSRYSNLQYFGTQSGNPELQPINADVWSYGVVWAPTPKFSIGADYHHWNIRNEVATQDVNQLMLDELYCTPVAQGGTGQLDPNSGTCQAALSQITRGAAGNVQQIDVKKVNIAEESLNAITVDVHYLQDMSAFGSLKLNGSATHNVNHLFQQYPTDPQIDLIHNPYYSSDPRNKANASVAWSLDKWTTTLYANYIGPTPSYRAQINPRGYEFSGAHTLPSWTLFNASINYSVTPDLELSFLVNNVFNKMPPFDDGYAGTSGAPYNSYNFNVLGRGYYLEARWNFGKTK